MKRVLVTGGAGFIGAHLARALFGAGFEVRALDNLTPSVHGLEPRRPRRLDREVDLLVGDVRDARAVRRALDGIDLVVHLAALVGVGQSLHRAAEYISANALGTAVLLEELMRRPVERLVVASSLSVYGEGAYRDADGAPAPVVERSAQKLAAGDWEPRGSSGEPLTPVPTAESKPASLSSVYALSKFSQERLSLITARACGVSAVALRLASVYGPELTLDSPHRGVLAGFAARLVDGSPPMVFEDGRQRRDFIHVRDAARAIRLALAAPAADGRAINIGSGRSCAILDLANALGRAIGRPAPKPVVTGKYRAGDVRHSFADVTQARAVLDFEAEIALEVGLAEFAAWLEAARPAGAKSGSARVELEAG